jgi:signal transduction histidine kinase
MDKSVQAVTHERLQKFVQGGGEMGKLILEYDWSKTSLGPVSGWPQSLLNALGIVMHSSFPMFLFWGKDLISFYNDAYRPSLGNNGKHPAIGKRGQDVWSDVWKFVKPIIDQVIATGKPAWFEDQLVPFFRNNKSEDIYWTFSHSAVFGDDGTISGVLVTCMETTQNVLDRKKIERQVLERTQDLERVQGSLIQANVYLQEVINLFKEPLQVIEPVEENGKITDFRFKITNAAYSAYANTTPEQLRGKRVGEVFPGYFKTSSFTKPVETFLTGIPDTWEIHYTEDGMDLYNLMSATKLGNNEVVLHFTDFTKLKHLQLQLLQKIDELEKSNRNLQDFSHAVSHDLKEPLRKIQMFIQQFLESNETMNEEAVKPLHKIQDASVRMGSLIDDLMAYSQLKNESQSKESVDLNYCLQRVVEDLELHIQQKNAVLKFDRLPTVYGHGRQLQQMIQNLLTNALKYSKADVPPQIEITSGTAIEGNKQYDLIKVKDNGIGFDPRYADRIFGMFSRLHDKTTYPGNGIGLSIVKRVVENHNGLVKVESTPGNGATFTVLFPVAVRG